MAYLLQTVKLAAFALCVGLLAARWLDALTAALVGATVFYLSLVLFAVE